MLSEISPLELIKRVNSIDYMVRMMCTHGDCYRFYKFLKQFFPHAKAYFLMPYKNHIVTKINNKYYDVTGEVEGTFLPLTEAEHNRCKYWAFSMDSYNDVE